MIYEIELTVCVDVIGLQQANQVAEQIVNNICIAPEFFKTLEDIEVTSIMKEYAEEEDTEDD
ncbi:MAG: hypothetical protein ACXW1D_00135 [Halobacteriota archaeon]